MGGQNAIKKAKKNTGQNEMKKIKKSCHLVFFEASNIVRAKMKLLSCALEKGGAIFPLFFNLQKPNENVIMQARRA